MSCNGDPDPGANATDRLRDDILSGVLAPGNRLVEAELTGRYQVGRSSVRTAFVELAKEGLVVREANRGATVRTVSLAEAIQVLEARQALEALIAAAAARHATEAERRELSGVGAEMTAAVDDELPVHYSELNERFHRRLREMSGHDVAAELVGTLRARTSHQPFRLALLPGRPQQSLPQHLAIIDAVVKGDPDRAAAAMADHLQSVIDALVALTSPE